MSDFKHINEFRKGSILRSINEDPTYLSFFLMFDTVDRSHSPLLSGAAEEYLKNFVDGGADEGPYVTRLRNFKKVLLKINKEMPWFWQKVSGLEATQQYGKMEEPFRGAEKPKIDIECLEENIELTAIGLMTLYKNAVYDYARFVEVLPKNLRHFRIFITMSEVRTFQQDTGARDLDLYGSPMSENAEGKSVNIIPRAKGYETATSKNAGKFDGAAAGQFSPSAKPFVTFELGFCEFIQDAIADMFADASKQPELKKPKISFTWNTASMSAQKFGPGILKDQKDLVTSKPDDGLYPNQPFNPLAIAQNAISDKVNGLAGSLVNRFNNLKNSLPGQGNNPMGRVYPEGLTGAAATIASAGMDKVKSLILDNVHGASTGLGSLGDINSALEAGSINGIMNLAGQLFKPTVTRPENTGITPVSINDGPGVDSSPDGPLNHKVYPQPQAESTRRITPGRIYEPGIDSSPDNSLNDNIHE